MNARRWIGIDPGPVPGFVVLEAGYVTGNPSILVADVIQCTERLTPGILTGLLHTAEPTAIQIEQFVVGNRSARSATSHAGSVTRELIGRLQTAADHSPTGTSVVLRPAAAVKPWATDARLDAAGLLATTKGMRHARDAARHALFLACRDGGLPDPLSKEFVQ